MQNIITNAPPAATGQGAADINQAQGLGALNPSPQANLSEREKGLIEYCKNIDNLVDFGIIQPQEGQAMKINLMKELSQQPEVSTGNEAQSLVQSGFMQFLKEQPKFFENRDNLKQYLEIVGVELDKDDFAKIAQLVEDLENAAVSRFADKSLHGEALKEFNEQAKERLKTLSSSVAGGRLEAQKYFTPEEIGKMSPQEFRRNEHIINEQMKKGRF